MSDARELYRVEGLPIFQNRMYPSREEARNCPRGDVVLVEDLTSGLIYNQAFDPALMVYDAEYQNEQGNSPLFQRHLQSIAELVETTMGREGLVEVGCGKGLFLELLASRGADIRGYDPTYEGSNPRIIRSYFNADLGISGEGLILRHVLEHIQNPVDFLHDLRDANGGGGKIYIEVPCLDWICENRTWFDVFYEHVNYFRLTDFLRIFGKVYEAKRSFGGQYLSIVADLGSVRRPTLDETDRVQFPAEFGAKVEAPDLASLAVWGGASKGVLFCLMMERLGLQVDTVIDINKAKQGKYLPATGIEVQSPEKGLSRLTDGATIYVMNSNYLPEIREMSGNRYNYIGIDND
ncbi:Methyltransferase domain-containing protein [Devosia sp. YR412]|uniref:class I SAM-dependent methyltransferase n=1 Tax=Devosia sp. YR412 TaxID=1881030 RepID=UPI0008C8237A|nr:class I SAM-dependent methyltransferase [Devosia sp. YR412]SEQ32381.1 Methyltransferase domain-containing protein [Devosia sp. YR412]